MKRICVIGGGITGRLVQWVCPSARVYDWRTEAHGTKLTRMYGANYLWEPIDGLTCRPLTVFTAIDHAPPTEASIRRYKEKIGKGDETPTTWGLQFAPVMAGWDLVSLPEAAITYEARVRAIDLDAQELTLRFGSSTVDARVPYDLLVSTIPQYALYDLLRPVHAVPALDSSTWRYRAIHVRVSPQPPDAWVEADQIYVNYITRPTVDTYRTTDRNGERHYESLTKFLGLHPDRVLVPGKIYPSHMATVFTQWLTKFNIFSFGRYATWEPNELVHETVAHIRQWAATHCR